MNVEEIVKNLAERAAREDHEKKIEALIKFQAAIFDKAAAYTNLVIVAGYAAFYAVWSKSEAYLPGTWFVLCALLVTFSALTFICFEVFKSLINQEVFKGLIEVVNAPQGKIDIKLDAQKIKEAKLTARIMRMWIVVFPITLFTGLSGAGLLLVGFGRNWLEQLL